MFNSGYLSFIATNLMLITSASLCQAQQATQPPVSPEIREAWRKTMVRTPLPKNGCFKAEYPSTEWHEVPCGRPSPYLNQKRGKGVGVDQVGYGYSGSNLISSVGSFPSIAGASYMNGVSGDVLGNSPADTNIFMLHRNAQSKFNLLSGFNDFPSTFSTPTCSGAPNGAAGCYGRRQFLFSQTQAPVPGPGQQSVPGAPRTTPSVFIEYWLFNSGPTGTCPTVPSRAVPQVTPETTTWHWNGSGDC